MLAVRVLRFIIDASLSRVIIRAHTYLVHDAQASKLHTSVAEVFIRESDNLDFNYLLFFCCNAYTYCLHDDTLHKKGQK